MVPTWTFVERSFGCIFFVKFFENTHHRRVFNIFGLIYVREGVSKNGLYNLPQRGFLIFFKDFRSRYKGINYPVSHFFLIKNFIKFSTYV